MALPEMLAQMLKEKLGGGDDGVIESALASLLGDGEGFDIASLVQKFSGGSLAGALGSWLGDGENAGLTSEQLTSVLGADKLAAFASRLGISTDQAANALSDVVPQLIDKNSSGGGLLDSVGGLASKLFN